MDIAFNMPLDELRERVNLIERAASASVMLANNPVASVHVVNVKGDAAPARVTGDATPQPAEDPKASKSTKSTKASKPKDEEPATAPAEEPAADKVDPDAVGESDEDAPTVTLDQVTDLAKKVIAAGKANVLKEIVSDLGIPKVSEAKPEQYAEIHERLQAALNA